MTALTSLGFVNIHGRPRFVPSKLRTYSYPTWLGNGRWFRFCPLVAAHSVHHGVTLSWRLEEWAR